MLDAVWRAPSVHVRHTLAGTIITYKGLWSSSTVHQYCMWSVRMFGVGGGDLGAAGSKRKCSGRSSDHFVSMLSSRTSSAGRLAGGLIA